LAPLLRERMVGEGDALAAWVEAMDGVSHDAHLSAIAPTLRDVAAKDGAPEECGAAIEENGRAAHDAHLSAMKLREDGAPGFQDGTRDSEDGEYGSEDGGRGSGARLPAWVRNEMKTVETEIKYAGYLDQQRRSMEKLRKAERRAIPEWFDYTTVSGLSTEMKQVLSRVRPQTLGQASRIAGVTPAAVSLIHGYIEIQGRRRSAVDELMQSESGPGTF